ncbi:hypothetical protein YT1_4002 [Rhodococcus ruber]|nr:hypothetical protein YT1_4002 [Rhodococcus ruber]
MRDGPPPRPGRARDLPGARVRAVVGGTRPGHLTWTVTLREPARRSA